MPAPSHEDQPEPGERRHGWQFQASSALEHSFSEQAFLPSLGSAHQAMVRSASGAGAASWLMVLPTRSEFELPAKIWQTAVRRRLRLPILPSCSHCPGCRRSVDTLGDHLANCSRCGNVQRRAKPFETAWQRVFREAGPGFNRRHS